MPNNNKLPLTVCSIDYDDCLGNQAFQSIYSSKSNVNKDKALNDALIEGNQKLLDHIICDILPRTSQLILMAGSNRQDAIIDNAIQEKVPGSCYTALEQLKKYLNNPFYNNLPTPPPVIVDKFLLSDVYLNTPIGENFNSAITASHTTRTYQPSEESLSSYRFDKTKGTILYAQTHKIVTENPDKNIIFYFYDDNKAIRDTLYNFFIQYPNLLPNNLTLQILHYDGDFHRNDKQKIQCRLIQGAGQIDSDYQKTVKKMAQFANLVPLSEQTSSNEPAASQRAFIQTLNEQTSEAAKILANQLLMHPDQTLGISLEIALSPQHALAPKRINKPPMPLPRSIDTIGAACNFYPLPQTSRSSLGKPPIPPKSRVSQQIPTTITLLPPETPRSSYDA